jgi:exodeoxyribonuclease VII small subunit
MADEPKTFDFTASIKTLEEINSWFQNEDFNLDEGLQKLRLGKDLIKKCRGRLQQVENEFVKIKQEFGEEAHEPDAEIEDGIPSNNGMPGKALNSKSAEPDDVSF